jgi:hypothetical protein
LAISQPNKNAVMKGCDIGGGSGFCWVAKKRQPNLCAWVGWVGDKPTQQKRGDEKL